MLGRRLHIITSLGLTAAWGVSVAAASPEKPNFREDVAAIFRNNCGSCHNPDKNKAGLDLTSYRTAMAGSGGGQVLSPGDPDGSLMILLITHQEEPHMPPSGSKLADDKIDTIRRWITGGAPETADSGVASDQARPQSPAALPPATVADGPAPMPVELSLEPVLRTERPGLPGGIAASPRGPLVALGAQNQVLLYDTAAGELLGVLPFAEGLPRTIQFSRSGALVLAAGGKGAQVGFATLYDTVTGRQVARVGEELDEVLAADVRADHAQVAVGGSGKAVKVYATATSELVRSLGKHTDWVTAIRYSPDGVLLASGDRNGGLIVWESATGGEFHTLEGHKGAITALAFRGDGNVLASASEDGSVRLWEMNEGRQIKTWQAHEGGVLGLDIAADGRIVTCGRDRMVRLWNADGGKLRDFEAMNDLAVRVALSHDGQQVIAGDFGGEVRVLKAEDGARVAQLDLNPPTIVQRLAVIDAQIAQLQAPSDQAGAELAVANTRAGEVLALLQQAESQSGEAAKSMESAHATLAAATATATAATEALASAEQNLSQAQQAVQGAATTMPAAGPATAPATSPASEADQARARARDAVQARRAEKDATQAALAEAQQARDAAQAQASAAAEAARQQQERKRQADEAVTAARARAEAAAGQLNAALSVRTKWQGAAARSSLVDARRTLDQLLAAHPQFVAATQAVAEVETFIAEGPQKVQAGEQRVAQATEAMAAATQASEATAAQVRDRDPLVQQTRTLSEQLAALANQNPQDAAAAQAAQKAGEALQVLVVDSAERQQNADAALKSAQDLLAAAQGALEQLRKDLAAAPARLEQARATESAAAEPPLLEARAKVSALQAEYDALRQRSQ
jgi:hypothetical protein